MEENKAAEIRVSAETIEAWREQIHDQKLTMTGRADAALEWLASQTFPSEARRAEGEARAAGFVTRATECIRRQDVEGFGRELQAFVFAVRPLTGPIPIKDEATRIIPTLMRMGYVAEEIDMIRSLLKPGMDVGLFDERGIDVQGRYYGRRELRNLLRPADWRNRKDWSDERWHDAFPLIPTEVEIQEARKQGGYIIGEVRR